MRKTYQYTPRENITAYEVALCEIFIRWANRRWADFNEDVTKHEHWDKIKKYFKVIEN